MPDAPPRVHVEVRAAAKPWRRSRTLWFNLAATVPLLLDAAAANLGLLQPLIPPRYYPLVVACITIGNLWLRAITTSPLVIRRREGEP